MYWVVNRCCDLVQLFRWTIAQSHRNRKVSHESQSRSVRILEFGSSPYREGYREGYDVKGKLDEEKEGRACKEGLLEGYELGMQNRKDEE